MKSHRDVVIAGPAVPKMRRARTVGVPAVTQVKLVKLREVRLDTFRGERLADLLETGLDPEEIYLDVYANAPAGRPRLLAEALQTLVVEPELGLAWVTVPPGAMERHGVSADDLDGLVEFPRSIEGIRLAILFREASQGRIKVSLRSVGSVDVAAFAKPFGGGGHAKAAGLALPGSLAEVQATVLHAAREYISGS